MKSGPSRITRTTSTIITTSTDGESDRRIVGRE
jgi:hypothetical protein